MTADLTNHTIESAFILGQQHGAALAEHTTPTLMQLIRDIDRCFMSKTSVERAYLGGKQIAVAGILGDRDVWVFDTFYEEQE